MLYLVKDRDEIIGLYQVFGPDYETPSVIELEKIVTLVVDESRVNKDPFYDVEKALRNTLLDTGYRVLEVDYYVLGR